MFDKYGHKRSTDTGTGVPYERQRAYHMNGNGRSVETLLTRTVFVVSESEDDGVGSECKNSVDDEHWVACDQCNLWYHLSCTDLDKIPGPDDAWICSVCSDI